jgi:hypothetical protein
MPLARLKPGFAVFPYQAPAGRVCTNPAATFIKLAFRLEHPCGYLVEIGLPIATPLMGFASLQHMRNRRSRCERPAGPSRKRPQGLVTLSTLINLRRLAGFVSHRQRSWDSPFEAYSSRKASGGFPPEAPTYRLDGGSRIYPKVIHVEPASSVSGLCSFRESLAIKPVFSGPIAGCSLGFCSSRVVGQEPCRDFAQASSHVLKMRK